MVAIMTCGTAGGTAGQIAEKRVTLVGLNITLTSFTGLSESVTQYD